MNIIDFAISKVGASHLPKNVPCQDASLSYSSEDGDIRISIVCDGHGSSTYVRSDRGSRYAAEITCEVLVAFAKKTNPSIFFNKKGAVTARPSLDETLWGKVPSKPLAQMTEVEKMNYEQNQLFYSQIQDIREQDDVIQPLFIEIYQKWLEAIKNDFDKDPFTEDEKTKLGNNRLAKAYGSTLMAYLQTPFYYLAFQIGDGRLLAADKKMTWRQLVPWDCNCFQNFTTSLCNSNPVRLFRYAFNGCGEFPAAVMCGSDGMEDSYGDYELAPYYLHNFYTGILRTFLNEGKEVTINKLNDFLPKLSAHGSKDDMSMAGIINMDALENGLELYDILYQRDSLNKAHDIRSVELGKLESKLVSLEESRAKLQSEIGLIETTLQKIKEKIDDVKNTLLDLNRQNEEELTKQDKVKERGNLLDSDIEQLKNEIEIKKKNNISSDDEARQTKSELKKRHDVICRKIEDSIANDVQQWQETVNRLLVCQEKDTISVKTENDCNSNQQIEHVDK